MDLRLLRGGMTGPSAASSAAPTPAAHAPPSDSERPARVDHDKSIAIETIKAADAEKTRAYEIQVHRLQGEENQRRRDDEHRARLTWIGLLLIVLTASAVGLAYALKPEVGDKILTPAFTFIGTIAGGLGSSRMVAGKTLLPAKDEGGGKD